MNAKEILSDVDCSGNNHGQCDLSLDHLPLADAQQECKGLSKAHALSSAGSQDEPSPAQTGQLDPSMKLRTKAVHVLITNACNLSCGGCNQLIGHMPKEKTFHVPIATVRSHIQTSILIAEKDWHQPWFPPMHRNLSIYGGEPTVHPEWPAILQMLYDEFPDWPFVVLTNGRTFSGKDLPQSGDERFAYIKKRKDIKAHHKNIFWRISPKHAGERFLPTLVAPIDIIKDPDLSLYYRMAQDNCPHYERCETLIYNGKGYFCVNAGPMDLLFHDGANGWDIDNVEHPFERTNEEIEAQARLFCHRCYYCLGREPAIKELADQPLVQLINMKSFVSETNVNHIAEGSGTFVVFDNKVDDHNLK